MACPIFILHTTGLLLEMYSRLIIVNKRDLLCYISKQVHCTAYLFAQSFFAENRGKKVASHLAMPPPHHLSRIFMGMKPKTL